MSFERGGAYLQHTLVLDRSTSPLTALHVGEFDSRYVLQQLQCGGMTAALKVTAVGYPSRCTFADLHDLFKGALRSLTPHNRPG